jgi:hypothetical protein
MGRLLHFGGFWAAIIPLARHLLGLRLFDSHSTSRFALSLHFTHVRRAGGPLHAFTAARIRRITPSTFPTPTPHFHHTTLLPHHTFTTPHFHHIAA